MNVRTLVEIRGGTVRIQEGDRETTVTVTVDGQTSTGMTETEAANVLDQAERAGKVPALEAKIRDLEDRLVTATGHRIANKKWAERTEALLDETAKKLVDSQEQVRIIGEERRRHARRVHELEADITRRVENQAEQMKLKDDTIAALEAEAAKHGETMIRISNLVHGADVKAELAHWSSHELADRIHRIREVFGTPKP